MSELAHPYACTCKECYEKSQAHGPDPLKVNVGRYRCSDCSRRSAEPRNWCEGCGGYHIVVEGMPL
jgi:predicted SprT family Zn-dependent metalloprotease